MTAILGIDADRWQTTPAQLTNEDIDTAVAEYGARLADVYAAQVRLYEALLSTDLDASELAASDLVKAINALPKIPAWPDTDEEFVARLRGKFATLADHDGQAVARWNGEAAEYRPANPDSQ